MGRRKQSGMEVNLFPFLSVLVAIIGCLTLIIVVLSLSQSDQKDAQTPEEVVMYEEWKLLKKEKEKEQTELDKLRNIVEDLIQKNRDTIAKREKLQSLKDEKENQEETDKTRDEITEQINTLVAAIEGLDTEHPVIEEEIKKLEAQLAELDKEPEPQKMRVRPSGSDGGRDVPTYFVEAANKSLMIHQSLSEDPKAIPMGAIMQNKEFVDLLKLVSSKNDSRLVFLIRADKGSSTAYKEATEAIDNFNKSNKKNKVIPGRLPLPGDGKADLSSFAKYLRP